MAGDWTHNFKSLFSVKGLWPLSHGTHARVGKVCMIDPANVHKSMATADYYYPWLSLPCWFFLQFGVEKLLVMAGDGTHNLMSNYWVKRSIPLCTDYAQGLVSGSQTLRFQAWSHDSSATVAPLLRQCWSRDPGTYTQTLASVKVPSKVHQIRITPLIHYKKDRFWMLRTRSI